MTERRSFVTVPSDTTDRALRCGVSIQGQLLRLSTHHTVAIYLRQRSLWVAEFIDGRGQLVDANTWFRFNCGSLANSHALRRMALESAIPLSPGLVAAIEELHEPASAPPPSAWRRFFEAAMSGIAPEPSGVAANKFKG